MSEQSQYILVFSLGPVQPFIQQARKTRDLWIGSLLFSKLMEAAMRGIEGRFVFPDERTVGEIPDIPNKYIAVFDDLSQAQGAAAQSERQIAEEWQRVCDGVWKAIIAKYGDEETRKIWKRQTGFDPDTQEVNLDALFEIYWAIVERKEDQNYSDWLEVTEKLLAARKRLRDFKPAEEPGEKSAISGEREILHRSGTSSVQIVQFWKDVARKYSAMDISKDGKEHLDAIDTVKRFAMKVGAIPERPFPSTSSIATASFVESLLGAEIDPPRVLEEWYQATRENRSLVSKPPEATRDIPYLLQKARTPGNPGREWLLQRDGDLYFAETFVPRALKENYEIIDEREAENIRERCTPALRVLLRATDALKITRPTPYYSVIQMDGDKMGILLSEVKDEGEHTKISAALSHFARENARDLVEGQYPAKLVYAGGDDVLAFAPLGRDTAESGQSQHVLSLVDMLQRKYREVVEGALPEPRDEKRAQGVTASVGIVIAHHYTPLSYVLRSVREAEDSAKKHYGKNALVVTLLRRSGEQTRVGCHWWYSQLGSEDDPGQPIALFSRFYRLFKDDVLSPKCVHNLLEEAPALVGIEASAMQSEIKRVLKRQRDPARKSAFSDDEVNTYAGYLTRLAAAIDADDPVAGKLKSVELHEENLRYGLIEVLGWLLVMAFLARKEQE